MRFKKCVENYYFDQRKLTELRKTTPSINVPFSSKIGTITKMYDRFCNMQQRIYSGVILN